MREREEPRDDYWSLDEAIGEAVVRGHEHTIRLQVHTSEERYRDHQEIVPLRHRTGTRVYFHARPYILLPEITLTIGLDPKPKEPGVIGKVLSSEWEGMRHQEIGNAQGWFYNEDRTLVLWECYLFDDFRRADNPSQDANLAIVWAGFEKLVLDRSRGAERIVVPAWEPEYPEGTLWQDFLRARGYRPFSEPALVKEVTSS